jgi:indole-3-glycerol phosphate synthase
MVRLRNKPEGSSLGKIIARKKAQVSAMMVRTRQVELEQRMYLSDRKLADALRPMSGARNAKPLLISEIRARAPWYGDVKNDLSVDALTRALDAGSAVIAFGSDEELFGGRIETVVDVREATSRPVLARDFFISEYQVYWARTMNADSIVLHASILPAEAIEDLLTPARSLAMEPVVEVFSEAELKDALETSAKIISITNRNPETNEVDAGNFDRLAPMVDAGRTVIAAGGFESRAQVEKLAGKADAVIIGRALVMSQDVAGKVRELGF